MVRTKVGGLAVALALVGSMFGGPAHTEANNNYVAGELLVQFRDGTSDVQQAAARGRVGASKVEQVRARARAGVRSNSCASGAAM